MFTQLFDRLGNWNPQLLREWNGRLKPLSIAFALILSILVQMGLVLCFTFMLPESIQLNHLSLTTAPRLSFYSDDTQPLGISEITPVQPIRGQLTPAAIEAEQRIHFGSTVRSINGQAVPDPATIDPNVSPYSLVNWANEQLGIYNSAFTLDQFDSKAPLGDPVSLELVNTNGSLYSVTLPIVAASTYQTPFCLPLSETDKTCQSSDGQTYSVNWAKWYLAIFTTLTIGLGGTLVGLGGFMIFSDLAQEQRRGTLNFVRLSPRSPLSIVCGKILGVPAPLYLSVLIALPLHAFTGLAAGLSGLGLLAFYLIFSAQLLLFYSAGFLLTLVNCGVVSLQAWIYSGLGLTLGGGATLISFLYNLGNYNATPYPSFAILWGGLFSPAMPLFYALQHSPHLEQLDLKFLLQFYMAGESLSLGAYGIMALITIGLLLAIVYVGIDRKFHNPGTTWIPRRYSYGLTIVLNLSFLLFAVPNEPVLDDAIGNAINAQDWLAVNSILIFLFSSIYLTLLAFALIPSRQLLLDWLRFKDSFKDKTISHTRPEEWEEFSLSSGLSSGLSSSKRSQLQFRSLPSTLVSDRSSPIATLLVNLFITQGLFLVWFILTAITLNFAISPKAWLLILGCLTFFSSAAILLILVSQICLLAPFKNVPLWTIWALLGTIVAHPVFMVSSYLYLNTLPQPLLFALKPETWMMLSTLFLQTLGILIMGMLHQRQLSDAARSEWQGLIPHDPKAIGKPIGKAIGKA